MTRRSRTVRLLPAGLAVLLACGGDDDQAREVGNREFELARAHYERQAAALPPLEVFGAPGATPVETPEPTPEASPRAASTPPLPAATAAGAGAGATPVASATPGAALPSASVSPAGLPLAPATRSPAAITPASRVTPVRGAPVVATDSMGSGASQITFAPGPNASRDGSATPIVTPTSTPETGSDSEPPKLVSITFNPPQTADGADVVVSVIASDNLSGAISGSGSLISPSGKIFMPFAVALDPASDVLAGTLKVPAESEAGVWHVSSIRLSDRAQNSVVLMPREDPVARAAFLTIASSKSDTVPPALEAVELVPSQVEDGGTVKVVVRARDEGSGVATVRGILANPAKTVQLNFYPRLDPASGAFEGPVALPKHSEYGEWSITLVTVTDTAGNRATFTAEDDRVRSARLKVVSSSSDTLPPQLLSIQLSPSRVQQGTPLTIAVVAQDDLSGVRGADGWVISPNAAGKIPFSLRAVGKSGEFTGRVETNNCTALGTWKVERLALSDGSGNRALLTTSDSALATATFDVDAGPEPCSTPPVK